MKSIVRRSVEKFGALLMAVCLLFSMTGAFPSYGAETYVDEIGHDDGNPHSGDAYVTVIDTSGDITWELGTVKGAQKIRFNKSSGHLEMISMYDKYREQEFVRQAEGYYGSEFSFELRDSEAIPGVVYSGVSQTWTLKSHDTTINPPPAASPEDNGSILLTVTLTSGDVTVNCYYEVYPSTNPKFTYSEQSIIRKWYDITYNGSGTKYLHDPQIGILALNADKFSYDNTGSREKGRYAWFDGGGQQHHTARYCWNSIVPTMGGSDGIIFDSLNNHGLEETSFNRSGGFSDRAQGTHGTAAGEEFPGGFDANQTGWYWTGTPWILDGSAYYTNFWMLYNEPSKSGIFFGANFSGMWITHLTQDSDNLTLREKVQLFDRPLASGDTFETPNSFMGVYESEYDTSPGAELGKDAVTPDTNDMTQQMYDWQYTFKWDYFDHAKANDYANVIWYHYGDHEQYMFENINLARSLGVAMVRDDDSWYDYQGSWISTTGDLTEVNRYIQKTAGMTYQLWLTPQNYVTNDLGNDHGQGGQYAAWMTGNPAVLQENPGWTTGSNLNRSWNGRNWDIGNSNAVQWMKELILGKRNEFLGSWNWRFDGTMISYPSESDSVAQYNGWIDLLKSVKQNDPDIGIQQCSAGAHFLNWDVLEYCSGTQLTDTSSICGPYAAALYPFTKFAGIGGVQNGWDSEYVFDTQENTGALDSLRSGLIKNEYLRSLGLNDRYTKYARPRIVEDQGVHEWNLSEYISPDRDHALITCGAGTVPSDGYTVKPVRLDPEKYYNVTYLNETGSTRSQDGFAVDGGRRQSGQPPEGPGYPLYRRQFRLRHLHVDSRRRNSHRQHDA